MENGWIKLHRKLLGNIIFTNEKGLKIWIWCLLKANHKENFVFVGRQKITIKIGEFIMGLKKAREEIDLAMTTIHYWLGILEREGFVELKKTNKYTVVKVKNWEKYQGVENKRKADGTHLITQMETNKKDKNVKNEKKENTHPVGRVAAEPVYEETDPEQDTYDTKKKTFKKLGLEYVPSKKTIKQEEATQALLLIDYFKQQAYELHGMNFRINPEGTDRENKRARGQVKKFYSLAGKDSKKIIDWFLDEYGEWCEYEFEQCFSNRTFDRWNNRNSLKKRKVKITRF